VQHVLLHWPAVSHTQSHKQLTIAELAYILTVQSALHWLTSSQQAATNNMRQPP
jgi:hypothetical protein